MINKKIIIAVCILFTTQAFAQSFKYKWAQKEYNQMRFAHAAVLMEQLIKKYPKDSKLQLQLADSYLKTHESVKAEKVYRGMAKTLAKDTSSLLEWADILSLNGKYVEASKIYANVLKIDPSNQKAKEFSSFIKKINTYYADSASYKIKYLNINSQQSDFSPTLYGKKMVFCSARDRGVIKHVYARDHSAFLDLYVCDTAKLGMVKFTTKIISDDKDKRTYSLHKEKTKLHPDETEHTSNDTKTLDLHGHHFKKDNSWAHHKEDEVQPFHKNVNSTYHEGPSCFDGDSVIYFTRNSANASESKKINLQICKSRFVNNNWSEPQILSFCTDNFSYGHPTLSLDKSKMYFVSNQNGGFGGTDIYYAERTSNGTWGSPINLGKSINTPYDELFPHIDSLNRLYFSSTGHAGFGGLDIFSFDFGLDTEPRNCGFPINSKKDDFGIYFTKCRKNGYFSSNRKRGAPDDDIYAFTWLPKIKVEVNVKDIESGQAIDSLVFTFLENKTVASFNPTDADGKAIFQNINPKRNYQLKAGNNKAIQAFTSDLDTKDMALGQVFSYNYYVDSIPQIVLQGKLSNHQESKIEEAKISLKNLKTGKTTAISPNPDGRFYFRLKPNSSYEVSAKSDSLYSNTVNINTENTSASSKAFLYIPAQTDCDLIKQRYFAPRIYFDLNSDSLGLSYKKVLDSVVAELKNDTTLKILLYNPIDVSPDSSFNNFLNHSRKANIINYLRNYIPTEKLEISPEGNLKSCKPISIANSESRQLLNRYVELYYLRNHKNISLETCKGNLIIAGKTLTSDTQEPLENVKVLLSYKDTIIDQFYTQANGSFAFEAEFGKEYILSASKDSCGTNTQKISTLNFRSNKMTINIPMLCAGEVIKLDNIYFDQGKYNIRKDAAKELDKLVKIMRKYPKMTIELRSHTDQVGKPEDNLTLSDNRAKSSASYVVSKGITKNRIVAKGFGSTILIKACTDSIPCTEADYQLNRRSEFKVLSVK